jgi:small subunit ribosomal protein S5
MSEKDKVTQDRSRDSRDPKDTKDTREHSGPRGQRERVQEEDPFIEKLIYVNRVAKVVKGGKNMSFSALTAVGDGQGSVGLGFGKAAEVSNAIKKSTDTAKKQMGTLLQF